VVKQHIGAEFAMKVDSDNPEASWRSSDNMVLTVLSHEKMELSNYRIQDHIYTVLFFFNRNGKFYGYALKGESIGQKSATKKMVKELGFITQVFKAKYCPENKVPKIIVSTMTDLTEKTIVLRHDKKFSVLAGVMQEETGRRGEKLYYYPVASICNNQIKNETGGEIISGYNKKELEKEVRGRIAMIRKDEAKSSAWAF
jgi:hypothetical protein